MTVWGFLGWLLVLSILVPFVWLVARRVWQHIGDDFWFTIAEVMLTKILGFIPPSEQGKDLAVAFALYMVKSHPKSVTPEQAFDIVAEAKRRFPL